MRAGIYRVSGSRYLLPQNPKVVDPKAASSAFHPTPVNTWSSPSTSYSAFQIDVITPETDPLTDQTMGASVVFVTVPSEQNPPGHVVVSTKENSIPALAPPGSTSPTASTTLRISSDDRPTP